MIKIGLKGRIISGTYATKGEILVSKELDLDNVPCYYVYIWPDNGIKWPGTDKDIVYDDWLESLESLAEYFTNYKWQIDWYDEKYKSIV